MTIAIRVEDTKNVPIILKQGIKGKKYPEHPTAKEFEYSTFLYPIDGVDEHLKYWPKNAKMRGESIDDTTFIIADVNNCIVGDLHLESQPKEYLNNTMSLREYTNEKGYSRHKFGEPEIVCQSNIEKNKILGTISFTKLDNLYKKCRKTGGNQHVCIEQKIKKHISDE